VQACPGRREIHLILAGGGVDGGAVALRHVSQLLGGGIPRTDQVAKLQVHIVEQVGDEAGGHIYGQRRVSELSRTAFPERFSLGPMLNLDSILGEKYIDEWPRAVQRSLLSL